MRKILSVEDNAEIRRLISWSLEDESDFELHFAVDGAQGWDKVRDLKPALVLLDVMMPGDVDGFEVCRRIKDDESLKATKVVMLTARAQRADVETSLRLGADTYMLKPFSPAKLIDTIHKLLDVPAA